MIRLIQEQPEDSSFDQLKEIHDYIAQDNPAAQKSFYAFRKSGIDTARTATSACCCTDTTGSRTS